MVVPEDVVVVVIFLWFLLDTLEKFRKIAWKDSSGVKVVINNTLNSKNFYQNFKKEDILEKFRKMSGRYENTESFAEK